MWAMLCAAAGPGLTIGAAVGLVLVGVDRLWAMPAPVWVLVAVPVVVGMAIGLGLALGRRRVPLLSAVELDEQLRLNDALGTALAMSGRDDVFAQIAVRDGERVAERVDVRAAVPVTWGRAWVLWPALCAAAVAVGVYVPRATWGAPMTVALADDPGETADLISELAEEAREELSDPRLESTPTAEALESIDQLEEELRAGERDPNEARTAAAERFEELAREFNDEAQHERGVDEKLRDRLGELEPDAGELADNLRDGDFESAREAARESLRGAPELSADERDRLRQELNELADAIDQTNEPPADPPESVEPRRSRSAQTKLERVGIDPDTARRTAEQEQEQRRREDAEREAQREWSSSATR